MDYSLYLAVVRTLHILGGIGWVGQILYLNFVQYPALVKMDATVRAEAAKHLRARSFVFSQVMFWSSFGFGVLLAVSYAARTPGYYRSGSFRSVIVGGSLTVLSYAGTMLLIPRPPRESGASAGERRVRTTLVGRARATRLWSRARVNVVLSVVTVFFMVAAGHLANLWD